MFVQQLSLLPTQLDDFVPGPAATDRASWNGLDAATQKQLLEAGTTALEQEWPALPASLYAEFTTTGNRVRFEEKYFGRRKILNALVLAECVERKGHFLDGIIEGIQLICEEAGWQLPAHNTQSRDAINTGIVDPEKPVIDLFAAETGAQLATLTSLLADDLKAHNPEIIARIDQEIETRITRPYLTRQFWWMGNGDERMNNWTVWCTQNILLATFTCPTDQKTRHDVVKTAVASLDAFLKTYAEDGACEEGAHYYGHAGLCLFNALNILANIAPQAFAPLWNAPKIKNMAEYIVHAHAGGGWYFNFADSPPKIEPLGAREFLFGSAVGSQSLIDFAVTDWRQDPDFLYPDEINLLYRLQTLFAAKAMHTHQLQQPTATDHYYPGIGLLIARDTQFALAVKAGNNGDGHNHNDVGSFIIYKNDQPFLIDVGVETYTSKTFSPDRYDIWTMQSAFHNLQTFGGVMQHDGAEFAAKDVDVKMQKGEVSIKMQLAEAYPHAAKLRSYTRHVQLIKDHEIVVEDQVDSDLSATLSLMFAALPTLSKDTIILDGVGKIIISGGGELALETINIQDARLRKCWPETLYRVLVPVVKGRLRLAIS